MTREPNQDSQDRDDQAYALMQSALALVPQGEWAQAAADLEQAADLHAQAGRSYDQARCLQLAATLRRSGGQTGEALSLVRRAAAVAASDLPMAVSIHGEQAEGAFADGQYEQAVAAWTVAINQAGKAGIGPDGLSAMLRRRAASWMALGQVEQAGGDFDEAWRLVKAAHGADKARFVRVEQAGRLLQYGHVAPADRVADNIKADLENESASPHLLAELYVLRARLARAVGKLPTAADYAGRARQAALDAVAPVSYFAAAVELAEALEGQGDRIGAYGILATAWVTLADLLGQETAGSWVEPCMLGYKIRWGDPAFLQAKAGYEAQRREALQRG
jgi:tetratricopeptide (TPR) repeat protein